MMGDTNGDQVTLRPGAHPVPLGLILVGLVSPVALAVIFRSIWPPLAQTVGMVVMVCGLVLYIIEERNAGDQRSSVVADGMRRLTDLIEASTAVVERLETEVALVTRTVASERQNLGMVAGGLGDMRQIVHLERRNLGMMANGVGEIRKALQTLQDALEETRKETQTLLAGAEVTATELRAVALRQDDLHGQIEVQRRNLGMVAGALDDLRRVSAGVKRFDVRQTAFEDALIALADRIDQGDGADLGQSESEAPGDKATSAAPSAGVPERARD